MSTTNPQTRTTADEYADRYYDDINFPMKSVDQDQISPVVWQIPASQWVYPHTMRVNVSVASRLRPVVGVVTHRVPQMTNPKVITPREVPRILHVHADTAGCGFWRLGLVEMFLNYGGYAVINTMSQVIESTNFFRSNWDAIRLQRQSTPSQAEYFKGIRKIIDTYNLKTRLIYEIDDIVIDKYLPEFNMARPAFTKPEIQNAIRETMALSDEITVVSPYMGKMYEEFSGNPHITIIPNYAPKMWFDGFYDLDKRMHNYDINKARPRVMLSGGGTHFNPRDARTDARGDYAHMLSALIAARKDFKFVWMGGCPPQFRSFVQAGEMEEIPWTSLFTFPTALNNAGCQASVASLENNHFNRAKSSIKFQEACYEGYPFIGQALEPYDEAFHRFVTGDECIDLLKESLKDEQTYQKECILHREKAEDYWLDNHFEEVLKVYTTKWGDESRRAVLEKWNPGQFKP